MRGGPDLKPNIKKHYEGIKKSPGPREFFIKKYYEGLENLPALGYNVGSTKEDE